MAERWIVASGTWDASNTSIWSATSGGASGASAPTSSDDVYTTIATTQAVTIAAGAVCRDFSPHANTTFIGSGTLTIYRGTVISDVSLFQFTGTITFAATINNSTTDTGFYNGILACNLVFNGVGGGWGLTTNLSSTGSITLTNGSLNTNGVVVSCTTFNLSNANTRSLLISHSIIYCTNWTATTTTNLTFVGTGAIIEMSSGTFAGGGLTYNNVIFDGTTIVTGANSFLYTSFNYSVTLPAGVTQTITTRLTSIGSAGSIVIIKSSSGGSPATISSSGAYINVNFVNIKDITASGGASFIANNSINTSGNTGWTFSGVAPSYNTSIITAVARVQQGFAVPRFLMAGKGGAAGTTYAIYKQGTTYGLNIWRSKPKVMSEPFIFKWLRLRLSTPVTTGVLILPSLRFDDGTNVIYGTEIKPLNYPNGDIIINMTSDNFSGDNHGDKNVVLELDFQGSTLCAVELPITMILETVDAPLTF